jgi:hypothetical protein
MYAISGMFVGTERNRIPEQHTFSSLFELTNVWSLQELVLRKPHQQSHL